eukprot:1772005-Rhodomonas_salina.1
MAYRRAVRCRTDTAYQARASGWYKQYGSMGVGSIRACYAMPGMDIAVAGGICYALATRCPVLTNTA